MQAAQGVKKESVNERIIKHELTKRWANSINYANRNECIETQEQITQRAIAIFRLACHEGRIANGFASRLVACATAMAPRQNTTNDTISVASAAAVRFGRDPWSFLVFKEVRILGKNDTHSMSSQEQGGTHNSDGTVDLHFVIMVN